MSARIEHLDDVIRVHDDFYIRATSSRIEVRTRVLKDGDTFALFDRHGDAHPIGLGEQGLYHRDTRFLSRLETWLGDGRPLLLSSTVRDDNAVLAVDLANPDVSIDGDVVLPANSYHVFRSMFLWRGRCFQRFRVHNYAPAAVRIALRVLFDADFADIFEIRGTPRPRRGEFQPPQIGDGEVLLGYVGLDGVSRRTRLVCSPPPSRLSASEIRFEAELEPNAARTFYVTVSCEDGSAAPSSIAYDQALAEAAAESRAVRARLATVETSNEQFNDWLTRSTADLHMMLTRTPHGMYPYAGVPWFNTVFGRDGIITALECLWIDPWIAQGVLGHLAATQATAVVPERDAEPGKIVHEIRAGEMAAVGEVPFALYYGSIDSTPLFLVLAGAYYARTGDRELVERLWPSFERALRWIDDYADPDHDGFYEYQRQGPKGLVNQGWKDSQDSVFHADGALAEGPIALCEMQGYVYAAKRAMAELATALGKTELARRSSVEADELRARFEKVFWCSDLGTYALALDGAKRPCRVRSSNAGHALFTGIAGDEHAERVAAALLDDASFSGWGIRTIADSEARYNPMSYHNGSVWPHDNALIAAGLARYGYREAALRILTGLFDVSLFVDLHRLPELFCGFVRRPGEGPTLYPVACAPQAWAVGAVFLLLQVCLGLSLDGRSRRICFDHPVLPPSLREIRIRDLGVGRDSADFRLRRYPEDVAIQVLRRNGGLEIVSLR